MIWLLVGYILCVIIMMGVTIYYFCLQEIKDDFIEWLLHDSPYCEPICNSGLTFLLGTIFAPLGILWVSGHLLYRLTVRIINPPITALRKTINLLRKVKKQ